ncbi:MAG TPA: hypothetical protein PLQ35_08200 [bacterium]|nr:hypothetical protein [bacterium]HQL62262.1 hypothetical protein [bacterium]
MVVAIGLLNGILTTVFEMVLWPFYSVDPIWGIIFISLLTGAIMVWIFGKVSNQDRVREIRNRIRGNLIAVRLFQYDLGVVFSLQGRILRDTLTYMQYSLVPMLILIVPVTFIIIQLNLHFSVRPMRVGERAIVTATMRDPAALKRNPVMEAPEAIRVETPGVRVESAREISWRIICARDGKYPLRVRVGDEVVEKEIRVGMDWGRVSEIRVGSSVLDMLLYPGEPSIPASSPVESIRVKYRPLELAVFGWHIHWLILFFVLSIVFGFALKGVMGVEV